MTTVYFSIVRKPFTYPLTFKRQGRDRTEAIRIILNKFPDATILS